jgi:hypothetical protein
MRISNQHRLVESFHSQHPFQESDIILTYPADLHNTVREEYVLEPAPFFEGTVETARSVNTYSADNGTVSLKKNIVGTLVDVYA